MKDHHRMRAWDESRNDYLYLDFDLEDDFGLSLNWKYQGNPVAHRKDLIVELCTGLRDKNGVLVFEGDILQVYEGPVLKVEFIEGCFDFEENESDLILWENCPSFVEIIGNIHQNPELLKAQ